MENSIQKYLVPWMLKSPLTSVLNRKNLHTVDISSITYLPRLVNIVKERPLTLLLLCPILLVGTMSFRSIVPTEEPPSFNPIPSGMDNFHHWDSISREKARGTGLTPCRPDVYRCSYFGQKLTSQRFNYS